ncbi:MAG: L-serine ammonia-lyase, iron-sulfur-dependent, subunit alpha, partial [Blautia producta]
MEFNHGIELLQLCEKTGLPISQIMKKREAVFSGITEEEVDAKMRKALEIMKQSVKEPLDAP